MFVLVTSTTVHCTVRCVLKNKIFLVTKMCPVNKICPATKICPGNEGLS